MPYASNIQVVTDANGTAHAFLLEDGAIWQGVWNAEAARWDKGTIVPGAFGGETLQALVLPRFWTTTNNGGTEATAWDPALVLAYRVGQGSGAEIQASFGRWDAQGQLTWTAPVRTRPSTWWWRENVRLNMAAGAAGGKRRQLLLPIPR
jgi:hypothetical protein